MEVKINNKNGLRLLTAGKYCKEDINITFDKSLIPSGTLEITENGENSLEYSKFHSYYENKNYYYLYVDKINALILPKREFNEKEITKMNMLFSKSIKKTKFINFKNILGIIFSVALVASMIILIISIF